jgi:hypothetical protein
MLSGLKRLLLDSPLRRGRQGFDPREVENVVVFAGEELDAFLKDEIVVIENYGDRLGRAVDLRPAQLSQDVFESGVFNDFHQEG